MIRKFYIDDDLGGGDGDPKAPAAPKGYVVTTPQQRTEWNGFLDYLDKQGVAGKPDLDAPGAGLKYFQQYKKANPAISLTPEHIQNIQYEQAQLRKGEGFGSLNKMQLDHLRSGMAPAFLNRPLSDVNGQINAATSKLYYPSGKSYGTDIEHYDKALGQPATVPPLAASPAAPAVIPSAAVSPAANPGNGGSIALPDYNDPSSRLAYAKQWRQKYGPLMEKRGDTPLRINEIPEGGTDTAKNLATKAASKIGLDPALLYASAMEEGMSGLFPNEKGEVNDNGEKGYPINGSADFGLDQFLSEVPRYKQKGYLPQDFGSRYKPFVPAPGAIGSGGKPVTRNSANFKTADDALVAKAAYLKDNYDSVDDYASQSKVALSPKARDFFTLVAYNAGIGTAKKMIQDYNKNGYLKNDAFLKERPTKGEGISEKSYGPQYDAKGKQIGQGVYTNVIRRIKMADALKQEKLFD